MGAQGKAVDIIKRGGRRPTERFSPEKLHASVHAACLSVRSPDGEAELAAKRVTHHVLVWLDSRPEVTSEDLRRIASHHLKTYHPEAAYLYERYPTII